MAASGAFVAVGVKPDRAKSSLFGSQHVCGAGLQEKLVRFVAVRVSLRATKSNEVSTDWIADRDFAISLSLLQGLSDEQLESCQVFAGNGLPLERGALVVLWVPNVSLPLGIGDEVDLDVFLNACSADLDEAVLRAFDSLGRVTQGTIQKCD